MFWEPEPPEFSALPDAEIPDELLSGLERLSEDGILLQGRLRWRPHATRATGFLTKARLMQLDSSPSLAIARALASLASHFHEQGACEPRFEAQIRREIDDPEQPGATKREWRSITFYIKTQTIEVAEPMDDELEHDDDDDHDDDDEKPSFQPVRAAPRRTTLLPRARSSQGSTRFSEYADYASMMREDPPLFAMVVVQESHDRLVATMERLLNSSSDRLDRVLETQHESSRSIIEGMQMVTHGAGEIAGVGINLFRSGLEHQAGVARLQHENNVEQERSEVMREAVNQGSQLAQAVIMSNTVKRRPTEASTTSPERPPRPAPAPSPEPAPAPADDTDMRLEASAREIVGQLTPQLLEELRQRAPTIAQAVDVLISGPITAPRVRELIASTGNVGNTELFAVMGILGGELTSSLSDMIVQVNNKGAA